MVTIGLRPPLPDWPAVREVPMGRVILPDSGIQPAWRWTALATFMSPIMAMGRFGSSRRPVAIGWCPPLRDWRKTMAMWMAPGVMPGLRRRSASRWIPMGMCLLSIRITPRFVNSHRPEPTGWSPPSRVWRVWRGVPMARIVMPSLLCPWELPRIRSVISSWWTRAMQPSGC